MRQHSAAGSQTDCSAMAGKLNLFVIVIIAGALSAEAMKFPSFLKSSTPAEEEDVFLSAEEEFQPEPEQEVTPTQVEKSRCRLSGTTAACCANPGRQLKINIPICLNITIDVSSLAIVGSLTAFDRVLFSKDIASAGRSVCVPLPPPAILFKGCFNLYHLNIDKSSKSVEVCPELTVNNVVGVKFDCLRFAGGRLSITQVEDKGESSALLSINVNKGRPELSVKKPSLSDLKSFIPGK